MPALIDILASYVPGMIIRRLLHDTTPLNSPQSERFPAAVLFADISGFTALTERLAQRGPGGAEALTLALNAFFGQLIEIISAHGGDITKFAGDALTAVWTAEGKDEGGGMKDEDNPFFTPNVHPTSLTVATRQAAACALAIQDKLRDYRTIDGFPLALRIGVGAGNIALIHIGGIYGRWEFVISGPPLTQVGEAQAQAQPGQVILSPETWSPVKTEATGDNLSSGYVRLHSLSETPSATPLPFPILPPEIETPLRAYLPGAILARLAAGQSGWLAELRRLTVIFINLPDLHYDTPLEQGQTVMQALQTALYRYEGSLNKISVDEKGATLVAALGLPPLAHEDDPIRGVKVALAALAALQNLNWRCAIGVATGRAFCGSVGNDTRREYTMMGDVVNLAARLMQAAKMTGDRRPETGDQDLSDTSPQNIAILPEGILCDEATFQAAQTQVLFEKLAPVAVKGKANPVAIYRPTAVLPAQLEIKSNGSDGTAEIPMVGRTRERVALADRLQGLLRGSGSVVIIEGEAGIGKSRLVEDLLRQTKALNIKYLIGAGDAIEKNTPYHAWRPLFKQLFNLDTRTDASTVSRRNHVLSLIPHEPELLRLLPLLNAVVPLGLPDNDTTQQMTGQVRADNTHELLIALLQKHVSRAPLVMILEDAHWFDSASWALTSLVSQRLQPLLLVLVTRPLADPLPPEYQQLRQDANIQQLRLEALPAKETLRLVCQRLGVINLPEPVAELIYAKAEGHPFFSEELVYALRDTGLIRVVDRECRLAPGVEDLRAIAVPDTVEEVITSRIDRLGAPQQLTLKVASVIGRVFAYMTLHDIHPIEADKPRLPDYLNLLEKLDIAHKETVEPELAYIFKHVITQEVAYNLLPFSQRQQLHQAVAEWLESAYADDLSPFYALLAHHWSQAGSLHATSPASLVKAVDYLEKAGEQALRGYANQEAINFFTKALALADKIATAPLPLPPLRRAAWERQLGQAYLQLGQFKESRHHLEQALALLGRPVPATKPALLLTLAGQVGRQALHRLWPARWVGLEHKLSAPQKTALFEAARAYEHLAETYIFLQTERAIRLLVANAALQTVNLAERAGPSPELARAYSTMHIAAGLVPLDKLAHFYGRQAAETAQKVNQLPALAWVTFINGIYHIGIGRWREAEAALHHSMALCGRLGDRYRGGQAQVNLAKAAFYQGRYSEAAVLAAEVYSQGRQKGDFFAQATGLYQQGENKLRLGQIDEAVTFLESALMVYQDNPDHLTEPITYGLLAVARLRQRDLELALQTAQTAAQRLDASAIDIFATFQAYAGVAEVYLSLWEEANLQSQRDVAQPPTSNLQLPISTQSVQSLSSRTCRELWKFARVYPIGRPQAWLWQGRYDWLAGQPDRAQRAWRKSLAEAERLAMPYEQGLAHYEIGRHLPAADPARAAHLNRASAIFTELNAAFDVARVAALN